MHLVMRCDVMCCVVLCCVGVCFPFCCYCYCYCYHCYHCYHCYYCYYCYCYYCYCYNYLSLPSSVPVHVPVSLLHPSNPCLPSPSSNSCIVPASVSAIGSSVFQRCTSLTTVTIETGSVLQSIGGYVFQLSALTAFVGMYMNTNAPRHALR